MSYHMTSANFLMIDQLNVCLTRLMDSRERLITQCSWWYVGCTTIGWSYCTIGGRSCSRFDPLIALRYRRMLMWSLRLKCI